MARRGDARRGDTESGGDTESDSGRSGSGTAEPEVVNNYRGTGVTALMIGLAVIALLLIVFLAQNTDSVPIEFFVWDGEAPLFVVVLATLAATTFATLGVSGVWRRRRRRQRTEHEELERLRRSRRD